MKKLIAISVLSLTIVGLYSPAYAQTSASPASSQFLQCMQNAVAKRETSIIGAVNSFHGSYSAVLAARKTALVDAWKITDMATRNETRKAAWTTYRTDAKNAYSALKKARKAAWTTFKQDRIVCGAPVTDTADMDTVGATL